MIILEKNDNWISVSKDGIEASSEPFLQLAESALEEFEDRPFPDIYVQKAEHLSTILGWEILYHGDTDDRKMSAETIVESIKLSGRQKAILDSWKDYP